MVKSLKDG